MVLLCRVLFHAVVALILGVLTFGANIASAQPVPAGMLAVSIPRVDEASTRCAYDFRSDFARPPPAEVAAHGYGSCSGAPDTVAAGGPVLRAVSGSNGVSVAPQTAPPMFSQTTASSTFRHGPFAGQSIGDVAGGVRAGKITPAELPVDVIVRNGETLGPNTRSMLALRRGGVDPADWILNDVTGVPGMERLLTERLLRNQLNHPGFVGGS